MTLRVPLVSILTPNALITERATNKQHQSKLLRIEGGKRRQHSPIVSAGRDKNRLTRYNLDLIHHLARRGFDRLRKRDNVLNGRFTGHPRRNRVVAEGLLRANSIKIKRFAMNMQLRQRTLMTALVKGRFSKSVAVKSSWPLLVILARLAAISSRTLVWCSGCWESS